MFKRKDLPVFQCLDIIIKTMSGTTMAIFLTIRGVVDMLMIIQKTDEKDLDP